MKYSFLALPLFFVFQTYLSTVCLGSVTVTYQKTFGGIKGDESYSVQETYDKRYIITGYTENYGIGVDNIWLIKTTVLGDTIWTKTFGGSGQSAGEFVKETSDRGYIIVGSTTSYGAGGSDVYLIKTNQSGDTLWTKTYGGIAYDCGYSVQQTFDKGYIIAGHTESYGAGFSDGWIIKTDSLGDTLWTRTFGGSNWDYGYSVQETSDSGYVIVGYTIGGTDDTWLVKINASGNIMWTKTFGGISDDEGRCVQKTNDKGYIITGWTSSYGAGFSNIWLIKTDSLGDTLWTRTYGGTGYNEGYFVQQTNDNGYILTGFTTSYGAGGRDVYLIKTDSIGDTIWTKTFGGIGDDYGCSVQQTFDKGYILSGYTESYGAGGFDVYLIKTDSLGNVGVEENPNLKPQISKLEISQNPFFQGTVIKYQLPVKDKVTLSIYNLSGRCVKTLINEEKQAGNYTVNLNAKDLKAGIYFLQLKTDNSIITRKLTVLN